MSGAGANVGAGIAGYYGGRGMREDALDRSELREWIRGRRARTIEREAIYDPMEEEAARLGIKRERIQTEFAEVADPYNRRALPRAEQREINQDADVEFERPYRQRAITRGEARDIQADEDAAFARPYERRGIVRQDKVGGFAVNQAQRSDELGEMEMDSYRDQDEANENFKQLRNALSNFEQFDNVQGIEDYYNELVPDGHTVRITKVGEDQYKLEHSSGRSVVSSKAELLKSTAETFLNNPNLDAATGGYGGGQGISTGGYRGGPRSRTGFSGGKESAWMEKVRSYEATFRAQGDDPLTARMKAHAESSYSSRTPPDEAVSNFYKDILPEVMPSQDELRLMSPEAREAAVKDAQIMAEQMTEHFSDQFFGQGGGEGGDQEGQPAAGASEYPVPPPAAIAMLKQNPQLASAFAAKYGPEALQAVTGQR